MRSSRHAICLKCAFEWDMRCHLDPLKSGEQGRPLVDGGCDDFTVDGHYGAYRMVEVAFDLPKGTLTGKRTGDGFNIWTNTFNDTFKKEDNE